MSTNPTRGIATELENLVKKATPTLIPKARAQRREVGYFQSATMQNRSRLPAKATEESFVTVAPVNMNCGLKATRPAASEAKARLVGLSLSAISPVNQTVREPNIAETRRAIR